MSYILQVALTILFGPLFVTVIGFVTIFGLRKKLRISKDAQEYLQQVQDSFLDVSAQFSIPVAIAAVVRLYQSPPFFEISFLQSLTTMQFLSLLSTAIATVVAMPKHKDKRRILVISLYIIVHFVFLMVIVAFLRTTKSSWTTIQELSDACTGYESISPGFVYPQPHNIGLSNLTFKEYYESSNSKKNLIILGLVLAGFAALVIAGYILIVLYHIFKARHPGFLGPIALGLSCGVIYEMSQLQRKRQIMKAVTGTDFVDNQWGFGQVIAIFLWVPLLIQVLYYTCRMLLTSCQCNTRMITDFSAVLAHTYFKPTEQTELRRPCHRCRSCSMC
jgi:hypothetical protein